MIVVDLITKLLAEHYLVPKYVPHRIIGDVVRFTLAYNPGAAFSMSLGPYSRYIFGSSTIRGRRSVSISGRSRAGSSRR